MDAVNMIEEVAKAIFHEASSGGTWERSTNKDRFREQARAAIKCLIRLESIIMDGQDAAVFG